MARRRALLLMAGAALAGASEASDAAAASASVAATRATGAAVPEACHSGLVGQIRELVPDCIDACPQSCRSLELSIQVYLAQFSGADGSRVMCNHREDFECYVSPEHLSRCMVLIEKAESLTYKLPRSVGDLEQACHLIAKPNFDDQDFFKRPASLEGLLEAISKGCPDACGESRGEFVAMVAAYAKGGKDMASREVCRHSARVSCLFRAQQCVDLVLKAKGMGLPSTDTELETWCHRLLRSR